METIVKYLVLPSSVVTMSALLSLALAGFRPTRKWAWGSGLLALSVYMIFAAGPVSYLLLGSLEFQVPPAATAECLKAETIVVLAGYAETDRDYPLSSQVNSTSAIRLLEALMRYSSRPGQAVIISGSGSVPAIMRDVIVSAGVPAERVIVDSDSSSTYESAKNLSSLLGQAPFLLITSAGHMQRSLGVFRTVGTYPISVPTDYMTKKNLYATQYLPSPRHLYYSDLAIAEYAALIWYRLHGWV